MKRTCTLAIVLCGAILSASASAQDSPAATGAAETDEAIHTELRAIRTALTEALKKGDIDGQLAHIHKNVVSTWQNGRVVRGHEGLRDFLKEMNAENEEVFRGYKVEPQPDELTILYGGDTGIVFGRSVPQYHYLGIDLELENRWTATLVKENGDWKIAAYHVSASVVDNPLLSIAKRSAYWSGGICLAIGVILGIIGNTFLRRRRQRQRQA